MSAVVVKLEERREPYYLAPRYAEMVRLMLALMERMDGMAAGQIELYWNGRDKRQTASSVGVRLTEAWQAGVLTQNTAGGMNAEAA
jgi:hypothetical protein